MNLKNKNVIITGGTRGLGLQILKDFLKNGANVAFCGRDQNLVSKTKQQFDLDFPNQKIYGQAIDCSDQNQVNDFVKSCLKFFINESIHILINNAGIDGPKNKIEDCNPKEWIETINVNLFSNLYFLQNILPIMKLNNYGRIVSLSGGGATKPMPCMSAYAASKSAVVRLCETVAHEIKDYNIKINCLAPGALNTRMLDNVLQAGPEKIGKEHYEKCLQQLQTGGDSLNNASRICLKLSSDELCFSGRLVSAVWDNFEKIEENIKINPEIYTLRRIT
jgi:NAD(P)-dependent dehydrogenase (short-subunit alcohol dehydrogenase family)